MHLNIDLVKDIILASYKLHSEPQLGAVRSWFFFAHSNRALIGFSANSVLGNLNTADVIKTSFLSEKKDFLYEKPSSGFLFEKKPHTPSKNDTLSM